MVPDVMFFRDGQAYIKLPQDTYPVDYSYGIDHPILESRFSYPASKYNRVQVYGSSFLGESFEWEELEEVHDRLLQMHDVNLDTQTKVDERSQALLQEALSPSTSGQLKVAVNCGQELYDLVEVTDSRAGLSADKRRVTSLSLRYSRDKSPQYMHILRLGKV